MFKKEVNKKMNFSVHIDKETAKKLNHLVKETKKPRNALINQAIKLFLEKMEKLEWPLEVKKMAGAFPDLTPFETSRKELISFDEDPLK